MSIEEQQVIVSLQINNDLLRHEICNLQQEIVFFEDRNIKLKDDTTRLENVINIQADKIIELQKALDSEMSRAKETVYTYVRNYVFGK